MRRILPVLALAGGLLVAGCQNPDGSTDWGSTLALGAGAALATGLVVSSLDDGDDRHRRHYRRAPRRDYGYGYGRPRGYHGGYHGGYHPGYHGRGSYGRGW